MWRRARPGFPALEVERRDTQERVRWAQNRDWMI